MAIKVKKPQISKQVIDYLDDIFPDKCPDIKLSDKEVWYQAGQRSVVNHLIKEQKIQEEK